jgi:hypothetical protein
VPVLSLGGSLSKKLIVVKAYLVAWRLWLGFLQLSSASHYSISSATSFPFQKNSQSFEMFLPVPELLEPTVKCQMRKDCKRRNVFLSTYGQHLKEDHDQTVLCGDIFSIQMDIELLEKHKMKRGKFYHRYKEFIYNIET